MAGQVGWMPNIDGSGGTDEPDLQRWIAAQYTNSEDSPILNGGFVTGRTDRAYSFTGGEAIVKTTEGAMVAIWDANVTALVSTPATDRIDTIYVGQDRQVRVQQGGNPPAGVAILSRRRLRGGATATNASDETHNRLWAMPYGAQIGWLGMHLEVHPGGGAVPIARTKVADLNFWVPTDRDVELFIRQSIYGEPGTGTNEAAAPLGMGSMRWQIYLDDNLDQTTEVPYTRMYTPNAQPFPYVGLSEGVHKLSFYRWHAFGAIPRHFGGGSEKYTQGAIYLLDRGVSRF